MMEKKKWKGRREECGTLTASRRRAEGKHVVFDCQEDRTLFLHYSSVQPEQLSQQTSSHSPLPEDTNEESSTLSALIGHVAVITRQSVRLWCALYSTCVQDFISLDDLT